MRSTHAFGGRTQAPEHPADLFSFKLIQAKLHVEEPGRGAPAGNATSRLRAERGSAEQRDGRSPKERDGQRSVAWRVVILTVGPEQRVAD